jgi:AcrR family transcriptional regulator
MDPDPSPVKARRRYDSNGRQERARRVQAHILEIAEKLFLQGGYASTTVAAVAAEAGVSVETLYKTFGGKPGLIRAIAQAGLAGTGPTPAPDRSDQMSARGLEPHATLRYWAALQTEVMPRVAPIILLVRSAAATDSDMAALLDDVNEQRLNRMHHNARRLNDRGQLRHGVTTDQARDVMFAFTAPDFYDILVTRQGWSIDQYGDFIYRGLVAELLSTPDDASTPDP